MIWLIWTILLMVVNNRRFHNQLRVVPFYPNLHAGFQVISTLFAMKPTAIASNTGWLGETLRLLLGSFFSKTNPKSFKTRYTGTPPKMNMEHKNNLRFRRWFSFQMGVILPSMLILRGGCTNRRKDNIERNLCISESAWSSTSWPCKVFRKCATKRGKFLFYSDRRSSLANLGGQVGSKSNESTAFDGQHPATSQDFLMIFDRWNLPRGSTALASSTLSMNHH